MIETHKVLSINPYVGKDGKFSFTLDTGSEKLSGYNEELFVDLQKSVGKVVELDIAVSKKGNRYIKGAYPVFKANSSQVGNQLPMIDTKQNSIERQCAAKIASDWIVAGKNEIELDGVVKKLAFKDLVDYITKVIRNE